MRWRVAAFLAVVGGWFARPAPALAGMPSVVLNDWAALRVETISFFLGVLLRRHGPGPLALELIWPPIFPASHG